MWFWLIQAITGSILGNATSAWFEKTKVGKWFYKKTFSLVMREVHSIGSINPSSRS